MTVQTIAFEFTQVKAEKSAAEIEDMLQTHGADKIAKTFESNRIKAIYFQIQTSDANMPFTLPVNVDAVYQILRDKKLASPRVWSLDKAAEQKIYNQAERTAWRIIWHWLKSQLALIQTQMVTVTQVFLPYMLVAENVTLYEQLTNNGFAALMPAREITS